ncbi:MAG TPA: MoxR family ATPase [Ruminiclostridium sp.]|nr:MoxR family ATPase [Ruminiclostridium sp.]
MSDFDHAAKVLEDITANIEKSILGKRNTIELVVQAMACSGHVLIEDIPGVGKTSLVSALARSVDCSFKRIQFTPDILPSDVTGFSLFNPKTGDFEYRPGAVMSNFVLADEINRTSPKTQSSLLEVMEENQVTVDLNTYIPPQPFMVLATQNPAEYLGTYPLPESQIDRFIVKLSLGYPSPEEEAQILGNSHTDVMQLSPVTDADGVIEAKTAAQNIYVENCIRKYIVDIVNATRRSSQTALGASPRGSIALFKMSQARAMYNGREYVLPDDVKFLAPYVLGHRLVLARDAKLSGKKTEDIIAEILDTVKAPSFRVRKA